MADFFFALRMFAIAVAVSVLMQIRIGASTVERHSIEWIQTSSLVGGLRDVADGAIKATSQAIRWATGSIDATLNRAFRSDSQPGRRILGLSLDRSPAVKKAEEDKRRAAEAAKDRRPAGQESNDAMDED